MARWQYRLRLMNRQWGEGGYEADWHDAGHVARHSIIEFSDLQFRRKPRRFPASLVAAVLRRAGDKRQRGGGPQ